MKKIILSVLLASTLIGVMTPTMQAFASTKDTDRGIEAAHEHIEDEDCIIDEYSQDERLVIPAGALAIFGQIIGRGYTSAKHANHSIQNWLRANPSGYENWVRKVNDGRHCNNMCPDHKNPPSPYSYGFKDSYLCNYLTCKLS